jgi:Tfp pilus assembly protein PilZ
MHRDAKPISISVLTNDQDEEKAIREVIGPYGADVAFSPTMHHLRDTLFRQPSNGLLLCLTSLVGIDFSSKSFVQTLEQVYPVARIRWNRAKGTFALIASRGKHIESISDFVAICSSFSPRCMRRSERVNETLNVLVSVTHDLANSEQAFTMNISDRGCFLCTSKKLAIGDTVYMQIQELPSKRVIEGTVIRSVQWGVPFSAPGYGIHFRSTSKELEEELGQVLYYWTSGNKGNDPS